MKKIRLDGAVEHDVPEAVALHIDSLDAKVKALDSEKSILQGKLDSATEALEAEKKKIEKEINSDDELLYEVNYSFAKYDNVVITDKKYKGTHIWNVSNQAGIHETFENKEDAIKLCEEINSRLKDFI